MLFYFLALGCAAVSMARTAVASLDYHVRFGAPHHNAASVGLMWADSLSFMADVPPAQANDAIYGVDIPYRYCVGDSIVAQGVAVGDYDSSAAVSLVLRVWEDGAALDCGTGKCSISVPVEFDRMNCPDIEVVNPSGLDIIRHSVVADTIPRICCFSVDSLLSTWQYLDRNTNANTAYPGGRYRLGMVRDPEVAGGLCLIYLGGATAYSELWTEGRLKARLRPTRFIGHYDILWLSATGRPAPPESYADIDEATGIMTISLPLLDATLRFSRLQQLR